MYDRFIEIINDPLFWIGATAFSVVSFVGSILMVGFVLVRLPATYFVEDHPPAFAWEKYHPVLRYSLLAAKNLLGIVLVAVGIILSIPGVPGQGFLTILIGLMFINFPGKRRLERKLVQRPRVLATINKVRRRYGRPPLVMEDGKRGEDKPSEEPKTAPPL